MTSILYLDWTKQAFLTTSHASVCSTNYFTMSLEKKFTLSEQLVFPSFRQVTKIYFYRLSTSISCMFIIFYLYDVSSSVNNHFEMFHMIKSMLGMMSINLKRKISSFSNANASVNDYCFYDVVRDACRSWGKWIKSSIWIRAMRQGIYRQFNPFSNQTCFNNCLLLHTQ